ncbi:MAG TPA: flavodoxin [Thiolinea sp.]|nr:flavodoxin [Thiolinea sp.]
MNKIIFAVGCALLVLFGLSTSAIAQAATLDKQVLIVYLSRTNNTKTVADYIHSYTGGTRVALELATPYPDDYEATVKQVAEENASGYLPPLNTKIEAIQDYEVIFLGFPTWGMKLPPPMKSFLQEHNLAGKTVVPFNTNDGYGIGESFATVKELAKDATILEGFSIKKDQVPTAKPEVEAWLKQIGLLPKADN